MLCSRIVFAKASFWAVFICEALISACVVLLRAMQPSSFARSLTSTIAMVKTSSPKPSVPDSSRYRRSCAAEVAGKNIMICLSAYSLAGKRWQRSIRTTMVSGALPGRGVESDGHPCEDGCEKL